MQPDTITEHEFQAWVAGGEHRRAAEWLVLRYADEVMGMCMAMVRDRSTAEDLVQDVFSRAFVGLGGYRAEASSRTWLLKITRNRCFDHLRQKQRRPWGAADPDAALDPDAIPDEVPLPAELLSRRADVEAALDDLAEGDRALIVLRFRNGLDYSELALAFGLKPGTVRMRVSRALSRMRRALERREERMEPPEPDFAAPQAEALPEPSDDLELEDLEALAPEEEDGAEAEDFDELAFVEAGEEEFEPEPPAQAPAPAPRRAPALRRPPASRAPAPPPPPPPGPAPAAPRLAARDRAATAPMAPAYVDALRQASAVPPPAHADALGAYLVATLEAPSGALQARLLADARQV